MNGDQAREVLDVLKAGPSYVVTRKLRADAERVKRAVEQMVQAGWPRGGRLR
jgi:hypothetical protein